MSTPLDFAEKMKEKFEEILRRFVEIPSVSADPAHKDDMFRLAEEAKRVIEEFGGKARIWQTDGFPIVYGGFEHSPSAPTILFYNHLDVQPADEPEWETEPFVFTKKGDRYYARGATDDKGPAIASLFSAVYAREAGIPVNVYFIWELEEEIGSPSFDATLEQHKHEIKADNVVISDSIWINSDQPSVDYALRGLQGAVIRLQTAEVDAHSGVTGGPVPNPISELCRILMACFDPVTGDVKIPGFYDDVIPPGDEELESFVNSGFDLKKFQDNYGFKWLRYTDVREFLKRVWAWPTFEVHGIAGGYQGPGIKTIIPHWAEAKVSMRLVPDQAPDKIFKIFKEYVESLNPHVEVKPEGALPPYLGDFHGPYADAIRTAVEKALGKSPAFIREGGSIGAVLSMSNILGVPITMFGLSLPEHGYHAPNEFFDWGQAKRGIAIFAYYFEEVAKLRS